MQFQHLNNFYLRCMQFKELFILPFTAWGNKWPGGHPSGRYAGKMFLREPRAFHYYQVIGSVEVCVLLLCSSQYYFCR
uniref:Uncharacterized protein n=1 Tax=Salix viminalis TaxID=40686 RepID=A0A6N2MJB5_SALVM